MQQEEQHIEEQEQQLEPIVMPLPAPVPDQPLPANVSAPEFSSVECIARFLRLHADQLEAITLNLPPVAAAWTDGTTEVLPPELSSVTSLHITACDASLAQLARCTMPKLKRLLLDVHAYNDSATHAVILSPETQQTVETLGLVVLNGVKLDRWELPDHNTVANSAPILDTDSLPDKLNIQVPSDSSWTVSVCNKEIWWNDNFFAVKR